MVLAKGQVPITQQVWSGGISGIMSIEPTPNAAMFEDMHFQLAVLLAATGLATAIACVDITLRLDGLGSANACRRV